MTNVIDMKTRTPFTAIADSDGVSVWQDEESGAWFWQYSAGPVRVSDPNGSLIDDDGRYSLSRAELYQGPFDTAVTASMCARIALRQSTKGAK